MVNLGGTGQVKRDSYNGEVEWVVGNEVSKMVASSTKRSGSND